MSDYEIIDVQTRNAAPGRDERGTRNVGRHLPALAPLPALPDVRIREAVPGDLPFIDALQKQHSKAVGFMFTAQLEGHIAKGNVLVAEVKSEQGKVKSENTDRDAVSDLRFSLCASHSAPRPVGYVLGVDRYFKRDDVGIIYQMNIAPGNHRRKIGAHLLQAMFDRWPWGVKLCGCWCAQDLAANRYWEAMGFVPIAFRTGGYGKTTADDLAKGRFRGRIHIYWQKRIRPRKEDGSPDNTPYWYPSQTSGGAIGEDRIVLPVPPGVHWSEVMPTVLPGVGAVFGALARERQTAVEGVKLIESANAERGTRKLERAAHEVSGGGEVGTRKSEVGSAKSRQSSVVGRQSGSDATCRVPGEAQRRGGLRFGLLPAQQAAEAARQEARDQAAKKQKRKQSAKDAIAAVNKKNDAKLTALARDLRDRWQEAVAQQPGLLEDRQQGKYAVGRPPEVSPEVFPAISVREIGDDTAERQNVRRIAA